jgi:hypothetical protein
MRKVIAALVFVVFFTGCVTAHYTGDGYRAPVSPTVSFFTGTIPGLNQFLLGERKEGWIYLGSVLIAGSIAGALYGIENTTDQPQYPIPFYIAAAATAGAFYWQYVDGIFGSFKQRAEYKEVRERFVPGRIFIGMTENDFLLWRRAHPKTINETTGTWGVHQQWVYSLEEIYYFENGKLSSWQLSK